jgi:hypothetical protein
LVKNYIDLLVQRDPFAIAEFLKQMTLYREKYPQRFTKLYDCLIEEIRHYLCPLADKTDPLCKLKTKRPKKRIVNSFDEYGFGEYSDFDVAEKINDTEGYVEKTAINNSPVPVYAYTVLTIHLINKLHLFQEWLYWFNWLPPMIYKPDILFERARIQHGFFIAQCYMQYIEEVYNSGGLARQRIVFQQRIKIENAPGVLRELNNVGVNRATIFGDFDNIAGYIVDKSKAVPS